VIQPLGTVNFTLIENVMNDRYALVVPQMKVYDNAVGLIEGKATLKTYVNVSLQPGKKEN
jgi:hypothetical protein